MKPLGVEREEDQLRPSPPVCGFFIFRANSLFVHTHPACESATFLILSRVEIF